MYQTSNGTTVWLKSAPRISYLAFAGRFDCDSSYDDVVRRLRSRFEPVYGISQSDAFAVKDTGTDGTVVFCSSRSNDCAIIILGEHQAEAQPPNGDILQRLGRLVSETVEHLSQVGPIQVRIETVRPETSILDG